MQQLYYQISLLQQQLKECMDRLVQMEQRFEERNSSPSSVHIEKIEYKFDQLKVETLEGTLSIGLTPSDLAKYNAEIPNLYSVNTLQDNTRQYISEQIPLIFSQGEMIYDPEGNALTPAQLTDQLMQQVPQRIDYLQQNHRGSAPLSEEQLSALLKRDVSHALQALREKQPQG
ncbi:spore germination protein GerPC [Jeotgalibacillus proteolyticus]|uniref:Uncharacterized protein n=1 Tax=Jeotgalibacillus proteolyticus TaxID=2082395 RepID=A0A2S5GH42_9BACL|nr:spore germination protein GerPC [Jeotgalibacillus proteolyticus]PPA72370.1 hypothetical protein C4B60_03060 [Jeotgalibacillus proteolyticus]